MSFLSRFPGSLLLVALLGMVGCRGCDDPSAADGPDSAVPDVDAGQDDGGSDTTDPPLRPTRAGQVVPLLYGRYVEVEDQRDTSAGRARIIPLDDPSDLGHQELFDDLDAACRAEVAAMVEQPTGLVVPGCGADGVFRARVAACHARAAQAFAAEGAEPGLVRNDEGVLIDLAGSFDGAGRIWTARSRSAFVRASWAMLAVARLREAVGLSAHTLDEDACPGALDISTKSERQTLGDLAAASLAESLASLEGATAQADRLLRQRLLEVGATLSTPIEAAQRAAWTRGMTDSALERMKLYAAIPYGAFTPIEWEQVTDLDAAGRYPLVPVAPDTDVARAVVALASVGADVLSVEGAPREGEALLATWFDALREAEPLAFGTLGDDEAAAALERFSLQQEHLDAAARWLVQALRASGTPLGATPLARGTARKLRALRSVDQPGPAAYTYALTEAVATIDSDDAVGYAGRGLAHARELAQRVAKRALERPDLATAQGALAPLAAGQGAIARAEVCLEPLEAGTSMQIQLLGDGDLAARYRLLRGEDAAQCAPGSRCTTLDAPIAPEAGSTDGDVRYVVQQAEAERDHLYLVDRTASGSDAIVGAFSVAPLDAPKKRRCHTVPLTAALPNELSEVGRDPVLDALPRLPALPDAAATYALAQDTPVPVTWDRTVALAGAQALGSELSIGQAFTRARLQVEREILDDCSLEPFRGTDASGVACDTSELDALWPLSCLADTVASWADAGGGFTSSGLRVEASTVPGRRALALWAYEARLRELVALTRAIETFDCAPLAEERVLAPLPDADVETQLWSRVVVVSQDLRGRYDGLRSALAEDIDGRWDQLDDAERIVMETRALHDSRLALARLFVAVPHGLYELGSAPDEDDALAHALDRFATVPNPARYAEDTRIEGLLRASALDPRLPDLTLQDGRLDAQTLATAWTDGTLVERLRGRLVVMDPDEFGDTPTQPGAFLASIGVSQTDLEHAAARVLQLSEARGSSILPKPNTSPVQALGLTSAYPAPNALHLYASTEGRAHLSASAWPTSFGARGFYHALSAAARSLQRRVDTATSWSSDERATRIGALEQVAPGVSRTRIDVVRAVDARRTESVELELSLPEGVSVDEAATRYELWWTDSGASCATLGTVAGAPCDAADYRFSSAGLLVEPLEGELAGESRVRLTGFGWPSPVAWDTDLSLEPTRGRVYVVEHVGDDRRLIAAASLEAARDGVERVALPLSEAWLATLTDVLSYRAPGEGCGNCAPRSVCETTRCELAVCIRDWAPDGSACASTGQCVSGECDAPGCGDGARADGSTDIPYEACDDGNFQDGDGCSATCSVETRAIEPFVEEAYPAGPAPAVGIDGLGNALLVYTADTLTGETVSIKSARFDPFGVKTGSEVTLEPALSRDFRAEPNVAGLRDGGFVAVYASPKVSDTFAIAFHLITAEGQASPARVVDDSGAVQNGARVAAVDDGFVVVWTERTALRPTARVRMRRFSRDGEPFGSSFDVASAPAGIEQSSPSVTSSLGQVLVAWAESSTNDGTRVAVRARRFSALGSAVDAASIAIAVGDVGQPSVSVLGTEDYVVAWTSRDADLGGDVWIRPVRRFGFPLEDSVASPVLLTDDAEQQPVIAGMDAENVLVAYQLGAPQREGALFAPSLDDATYSLASTALSSSNEADVSVVRATQGVWMVWSERLAQSQALFALLLPFGSAAPTLTMP